ncbi:MAG: EAL domain-containing protein [Alphaproteobacteria bacterium]|nr:EAL domain-containing protein [Alphaproteobacteria bacterium]
MNACFVWVDVNGNITSAWPCIEAAEELGLMGDVDNQVLELVAKELHRSPTVSLAFNISGRTIDNPKWLIKAKELIGDPAVASRAVVEITETAVQHDLKRSISFVSSLQEIGCRVALDDFGTGYTSFRQLRSLPIDIVKIDGSFIRDIASSHDNRLFVKTLLRLIEGFGLTAVAEYVENGEIAKLLMDFGVPYFQGNYFSAAVNFRPWMDQESL